jgi:hypothetical protein
MGSGKIYLSLKNSVFWDIKTYSPMKVTKKSPPKRLLTQKIGLFLTRAVRISSLSSVLQTGIK